MSSVDAIAPTYVSINILSLNSGFIKIMGQNDKNKLAMANLGKTSCLFFVILVLTAVPVGLGEATTGSLNMKPSEEVLQPLNLIVDDRVLIQFKVIGATSSLIHFSLTFPNATLKDFGEVSDFSTSFVCEAEGEYLLNFTNNDPTENKLVTLNYEIDHYIFGLPRMLFMVIIIAVVSVFGVAVFIGLSMKP